MHVYVSGIPDCKVCFELYLLILSRPISDHHLRCESESESARYSIHLIMSITWSACGNGRKKKKKKKKKKDW